MDGGNSTPNPRPLPEKVHDLDETSMWVARKSILIVEDDRDFARVTSALLREHGYEVDLASDGVEGVKKIMVSDYAVILCDMVMPNLAGDMFYTAVERVKPRLCPRLLFITGQGSNKKVEEFIRKVGGLLLLKPVPSHVLLEAVRAVERRTGPLAVKKK